MDRPKPVGAQLKSSLPAIIFTVALSALLLGMVQYLHVRLGVPTGQLTQDTLYGQPVYKGILSQLGLLLWAAAAATCMLTATVLRGAEGRFFAAAGALTVLLCLDDAFLLHDGVFSTVISEKYIYAAYMLAILAFVVMFARRILATDYLLLAVAFVFFALSIVADVRSLPVADRFFFEDGTKAIGIVTWLAYFFRTGVAAIQAHLAMRTS